MSSRKRRRCSIAPSVHQSGDVVSPDTAAPVTIMESPPPTELEPSTFKRKTESKEELVNSYSSSIEQEIDDLLFSSSILEECNGTRDFGSVGTKAEPDLALDVDEVVCNKEARIKEDRKLLETACVCEDDEAGDKEHLFGLYPEDFSFTLNSSVVQAQEESHSLPKPCVKYTDLRTSEVDERMNCVPQSPTTCAVVPQTAADFAPVATTLSPSRDLSQSVCPSHRHHPVSSPSVTPASTFKQNQVEYPTSTFYGLPLAVKNCFREYRGICKLYGIYK